MAAKPVVPANNDGNGNSKKVAAKLVVVPASANNDGDGDSKKVAANNDFSEERSRQKVGIKHAMIHHYKYRDLEGYGSFKFVYPELT